FDAELAAIVDAQLSAAIASEKPLDVVSALPAFGARVRPFLSHLAVYTLNLITIAATVRTGGYRFEGEPVVLEVDIAPQWHRMMRLWQPWFSDETLAQFASAVAIRRVDRGVECTRAERQVRPAHIDSFTELASSSLAVGDTTTAGLALFLRAAARALDPEIDLAARLLREDGVDVGIQYQRERILHARNRYVTAAEADALLDEAINSVRMRWIGQAAALLFDTIEFAESVGKAVEPVQQAHLAVWESAALGLRREHLAGDTGALINAAGKVLDEAAEAPVDALAAVVNACLRTDEEPRLKELAAALKMRSVDTLCPRLLLACFRLARRVKDKDWLAQLYRVAVSKDDQGEPLWRGSGALTDSAVLDLYEVAVQRKDHKTADLIANEELRWRFRMHKEAVERIGRVVAKDGAGG
ncbi:MAG: hypothetical protein ACLGH0_12110, partial [Thermoanaerobaculia bacterium]